MTPLIVAGVGGAMVVTGLAILFGIRVDIASFLRLRAEPTPIANISGPGSYHVRGRTAATEQGTLRSPLTDREVLVYRIGIYERRYGTSRGGVERLDNARGEVEFLVGDESERSLRVSASDALFALDRTTIYDGLRISPESAPPEILEWIAQQLGTPRTNVRVDERVIEVGEQLSLNGPVRVDDDPQGDQLPRMTSPTTGALFITAPAGGSRSLVLRQVAIAAALVVLGGVGCLVGLVVL
jgi:E3 Ubiquitin ligase